MLHILKWTACLILVLVIAPAHAVDMDQIGNAVVKDLRNRYQDKTDGCGNTQKLPAFECSGIIFRATGHGSYDHWDPSPASRASGGVSFAYLRADIPGVVPMVNGMIFDAPGNSEETGKKHIEFLCYFPVDGGAVDREEGCGIGHIGATIYDGTRPCQLQGVATAEEWIKRREEAFKSSKSEDIFNCGFNIKYGSENIDDNARSAFNQGLRTSTLLWKMGGVLSGFFQNNEIVARVWQEDQPNQLPIQAFFYSNEISNADEGPSKIAKEEAKKDQLSFYNKTKLLVPIIRIDVMNMAPGMVIFSYLHDDQNIPLP